MDDTLEATAREERWTAAFYLALLFILVIDLMLLFWMFNPFVPAKAAVRTEARPAVVKIEYRAKPSPFDARKMVPKSRIAQVGPAMPAYVAFNR